MKKIDPISIISFLYIGYILICYLNSLYYEKHISIDNFESIINEEKENIASISIDEYHNNVYLYLKNESTSYLMKISKHTNFYETINLGKNIPINYVDDPTFFQISVKLLLTIIVIFNLILLGKKIIKKYFLNKLEKKHNYFSKKSISLNNKNFCSIITETNVQFKDVVGHSEIKKDLEECVKYFKFREYYTKIGFNIPKGLLFSGFPGTGKTLLAKALAKEAGVTFISVSGSQFIDTFVGIGSKRINKLFKYARENKPSIVFIDEIDSIGMKRSMRSLGHDEHNNTLNTLLYEIDGFNETDNIIIIGATNMPQTLDTALTRSGRFDKEIIFDLPNKQERKELYKMYLKSVHKEKKFKNNFELELDKLASMSANLSGADIKNIVNQAANLYMKRFDFDFANNNMEDIDEYLNNTIDGVSYDDLTKAIDIVSIGMEKKERTMSEQEKSIVAYHEAGHSLVSYVLKQTQNPIKISIIPRGKAALGYSKQEPTDKKLYLSEELLAKMCVLIGGRIGEKIKFNKISNGASDDIEKLTSMAFSYINDFGLHNKMGPINYFCSNKEFIKNLGNDTKNKIDNYVKNIIIEIQNITSKILTQYKEEFFKLAEQLCEKEELSLSDIDNDFNNIRNSIDINEFNLSF